MLDMFDVEVNETFTTVLSQWPVYGLFYKPLLISLFLPSGISQTFTHSRQNMALICLGIFNWPGTYGEIVQKI